MASLSQNLMDDFLSPYEAEHLVNQLKQIDANLRTTVDEQFKYLPDMLVGVSKSDFSSGVLAALEKCIAFRVRNRQLCPASYAVAFALRLGIHSTVPRTWSTLVQAAPQPRKL